MKKLLLLTFIPLLLASCGNNIDQTTSNNDGTSLNTSLDDVTSESSTANSSSSTTSTTSTTNTGSTASTNTSTTRDDSWFDGRELLDCGYYQMDLPKNSDNPIELKTTLGADNSSWLNNNWKYSIPQYNRYIYKNSCDDGPANHYVSPSFFQDDNGGLKIARDGVGLQSPMFNHSGEKLEIRIHISNVTNNSKTPDKGKEPLHVYFFDKKGNYLDKYAFSVGSITANSKNNDLKFYWTENAKEVAYFEIRLNAYPYKGSQCYNIGISAVNIKSWERI